MGHVGGEPERDVIRVGHRRLLAQFQQLRESGTPSIHVIVLNSPAVMRSLRQAVLGESAGAGAFGDFVPPAPAVPR